MHYTPHCIGEFINTTLNEGFSYLLDEKSLKRTYVHCPFLRRSQSLAKVFNSSKCHRSAYYLNKGQVHLYLIPRRFSLHFQKKKLAWRYFSKSDKLIELFCLYAISSKGQTNSK